MKRDIPMYQEEESMSKVMNSFAKSVGKNLSRIKSILIRQKKSADAFTTESKIYLVIKLLIRKQASTKKRIS